MGPRARTSVLPGSMGFYLTSQVSELLFGSDICRASLRGLPSIFVPSSGRCMCAPLNACLNGNRFVPSVRGAQIQRIQNPNQGLALTGSWSSFTLPLVLVSVVPQLGARSAVRQPCAPPASSMMLVLARLVAMLLFVSRGFSHPTHHDGFDPAVYESMGVVPPFQVLVLYTLCRDLSLLHTGRG